MTLEDILTISLGIFFITAEKPPPEQRTREGWQQRQTPPTPSRRDQKGEDTCSCHAREGGGGGRVGGIILIAMKKEREFRGTFLVILLYEFKMSKNLPWGRGYDPLPHSLSHLPPRMNVKRRAHGPDTISKLHFCLSNRDNSHLDNYCCR